MRSSHTHGAEKTHSATEREKFTDTYDIRICVRFIPMMVQRTHKQREKFFS